GGNLGGIFSGGRRHHAPTRSAPCAEAIRIMCRHAPHHAPRPSASCAEAVRIMCRPRPHRVPTHSAQCRHRTGKKLARYLLVSQHDILSFKH
ncbi:MAG: hypothetical protein K2M96_03645, partial [Prevotella sp.]|nr:hypothetical protein [Prevotella sp.]